MLLAVLSDGLIRLVGSFLRCVPDFSCAMAFAHSAWVDASAISGSFPLSGFSAATSGASLNTIFSFAPLPCSLVKSGVKGAFLSAQLL